MKILVTGGAGFIGSHIVDKLIEQNYGVVIVDNISTGKSKNINPRAKFYQISITDEKLDNVFEQEKPDYVIHQAAQVDVSKSIKDPILDAKINIIGSLNILQNCVKHNVKKIIYGNSGGAGPGEPRYLPVDEKHPKNPQSPYGVSKHTVEHYLEVYNHLYGLNYASLGYANVYGPRQDPFGEGGVIAIFTDKFLKNQEPIIFGDGKQTRDFVYVEDVAEANILALSKGDNQSFNVGTGKEVTINEIAKIIKEITKSVSQVRYDNPREGDIYRSVLDCTMIKNEIGWIARTELKEGLIKTVGALKND